MTTNASMGTLYIVATPIGNLADITLRAIETLKSVSAIVAEDTRHSQRLLHNLSIKKPLISLHSHNEHKKSEKIIEKLQNGDSFALISDAGTPLISDPGYPLVQMAKSANIIISPIPGPSAVIAALSAAALPCDRFIFEGFLPAKENQCRQKLALFKNEKRTVIFYEAPHRIYSLLETMETVFDAERKVAIAKELTKSHEQIIHGSCKELKNWLFADKTRQKGEFVVLLAGLTKPHIEEGKITETIKLLLKELPVKKAAKLAADLLSINKNKAYKIALQLQNETD